MRFLYNFGVSQDDAETERKALDLRAGDRLLCIASAGEVPLNLLTRSDVTIDAVDISKAQLRLTRLKFIAALHLEPMEAAQFLGYVTAAPEKRCQYFDHLCSLLAPEDLKFWKRHTQIFTRGPIHLGRFERFITRFNWLGLLILNKQKVLRLFEFDDVAQQKKFFDQYLNTKRVNLIFKTAFHPKIYKSRGMDEAGLVHSGKRDIAQFFFSKFRDFCTATLARKNFFLQFMLFNRVLFPEALPVFLTEEGNRNLQKNQNRLTLFQSSITAYLRNQRTGTYNKFALSNIGDWLTVNEYAELLHLIVGKARKPARALLRYIHYAHPTPSALAQTISPNFQFVKELEKSERFPFYNLIPMTIGSE